MPLFEIGMVLAGLVALYAGAEGLVKGSSSLALNLGITPLVVGLTVVSFGTSAPELVVSLIGTDNIAVGNILGSNVANIALILGVVALISPLEVRNQAVRRDLPIMIGVTFLFAGLIYFDGNLTRFNGIVLLAAMAAYLGYTFWQARKDMLDVENVVEADEIDDPKKRHWILDVVFVVLGIVGLAVGAKWMVDGAMVIAEYLGVSELVIGISVVALGTSLPELAAAIVAALRDEADLTIGNVIGSNIFNLLLVLGVVATIGDLVVGDDALRIDLWVMVVVSVAMWPLLRTGKEVKRWEGALLLAVYIGYMISLFLR